MSGGSGPGKKRTSEREKGWEKANAEFYSESYPTGIDSELDVLRRDPTRISTLLPSKKSRTANTLHRMTRNTDTRTMRRRASIRSRQSTVRRTSTVNQDAVVSMPDLSENLSNEERTWEEIARIKALPIPMHRKRERKAKLQNATYLRLQGYERFKWKLKKTWQTFRLLWKDGYSKLELWKYSFKKIEGTFGNTVVEYFLFIKWLVFLNMYWFIVVSLFIVLPTLIFETPANLNCDLDNRNASECCSEEYSNESVTLVSFIDIMQGTGWLEHSQFFYGFYTNTIYGYETFGNYENGFTGVYNVSKNESALFKIIFDDTFNESILNDTRFTSPSFYYDLPLAYVIVTLVNIIITFIVILRSAEKGLKARLIEREGVFYQYSSLIFSGWDFCINSEKSTKIKQKALRNEIKANLDLQDDQTNRTSSEKLRLVFIRTIVNVIVLSIFAGVAFSTYYIFDFMFKQISYFSIRIEDKLTFTENSILVLFLQYVPSFIIIAFNTLVPFVFRFLINYEYYTPNLYVWISVTRLVTLRLTSVIALFVSLYDLNPCRSPESESCVGDNCTTPACWETYVGQQIYKLMITDFVAHLLITFIVNLPRSLIAQYFDNRCAKFIGEQEFNLPKQVLDIVYFQMLCWLGSFYVPLLPILGSIMCFVLFYVKKFACLINSKPPSAVYRASRSHSVFMFALLGSYVLTVCFIIFSIVYINPSKSCGAFRGMFSAWSVVTTTFILSPFWFQEIIFFFGTSTFIVPILVILILSLYYFYVANSANKRSEEFLRKLLVSEGHDKQFLLNTICEFFKQDQNPRNTELQRDRDRNSMS